MIKDVKDLEGKKLIVVKGTTAETYFTDNYPDIELVKFDEYQEAYDALLDGREMHSPQTIQKYCMGSAE